MKKYKLLVDSINALNEETIDLLILTGEPGVGKTYLTLNVLDKEKIDYEYTGTYSTPLAFYRFLYKNKDKEVIVFDDMHGTSDPLIKSMFKSACGELPNGKRIVSYNSTSKILTKEELPPYFELRARVILIFNENISGFEPIINRGINIKFNFSFKDKLKLFEHFKDSAKIDSEILEYVREKCNPLTKNLSIRSLSILSKLKRDGYDFVPFAEEILEGEKEDILSMNVEEWTEKTGKHRRTYFRHKHKLLEG